MRKEKADSYPLTLHWVYILWDVLTNTYRACYTPNIVADIERLNPHGDNQSVPHVLFYREFDEAILAMGYREMLSKLSTESLRHTIRKMNPDEEDLREEILGEKGLFY